MGFSTTFRHKALAGVAAVALTFTPLAIAAETLGDALASAYRNSGLLEQNRANLRATDEGVAAALADLRPTLSYQAQSSAAEIQGEWTSQLTFNAGMTLYTFGRNKLALDAAKETVLATRQTLVNIEQTVLDGAIAAYMDMREQQALVNLRDSAVRLSQQNLRAARDRFEVGEITRTQVSQFEAQLASARAQLAAAQGQLSAAREAYKVAVGHYPSNLSTPPAVRLPASSVEQAVTIAKQSHPGIKALQHRVAALDLAVAINERSQLPSVEAGARMTFADDGSRSDNFSITASGPIYSGGKIASNIRKAIAQRDAARAELLQTTREIEQNVRANWSMLSVLSASEQASRALVEAQRVAYEGVREEAELGASTTLDVLDAEQALLDAQVGAIQAQIARETQGFAVLRTMGRLTVAGLNLNVPTYDPTAYYNAVKDGPGRYVSPEGEKLNRVLEALGRK